MLIKIDQVLQLMIFKNIKDILVKDGNFKEDQEMFKVRKKYLFNFFEEPLEMALKHNLPGPGTYDPMTKLNSTGVYKVSNLFNSKAANWSPNTKRFEDPIPSS